VRTVTGHQNNKYSINSEIVTDGEHSFIISGSEDKMVYIWGENGSMKSLPGHEDVVLSVAYENVSKCLVTGSTDGSLGVWRGIELDSVLNGKAMMMNDSSEVAVVGDAMVVTDDSC